MSETVTAYRLSVQQERLWSLRGGKELPAAICELELTSEVDVTALRRAVEETVARHEILRTRFQKKPGVKLPFQVVEEAAEVDWEEYGGPNKRTQSSSVFSASFVNVSPRNYRLRFAVPGLAADRQTLELVAQELGLIYQLFVSGEAIEGEPLQYADIVEWQNELLASEETKAGRDFWRAYLEGLGTDSWENLRLPLQRESGEEFSPDSVTVEIPSAGSADVLLACFFALLYRLTGRTQLAINREYDGRGLEELKGALGPLAKSLPVGVEISPEITFAELVKQVAERSQAVENWQHSFAWNAGEKTIPANPLAFGYVERGEGATYAGVRFRVVRAEAETEPHTLKLEAERAGDRMRLVFHYDASRLRRETVERWSGHFVTLLEAALEKPSAKVSRLPLLNAQEREQLLVGWNRTESAYPRERTIDELISEQAARTPERAAVRSGEQVLSYRELNEQAEQLAARLRQAGLQAGSLVALMGERSPEMLVGVLGIWKAGAAYVPLASDHPAARLAEQMRGVAAVVRVEGGKAHVETNPGQGLGVETSLDTAGTSACATGAEGLAYVIYTSGSTGMPKGVAVRHRNLVNYACFIQKRLELERFPEGLQFATVSALQADLGHTAIFPALLSGGTVHLIPQDVATDSKALGEYFERYQIDVLKIVPSHLRALLESDSAQKVLPRKYLIFGGELLTRALVERIETLNGKCEVVNHYGPTETTVGSLTLRLKDGLNEHDWRSSSARTIPIGRPIANTQVYILDAHLQPVPVGVAGELYIAGEGVSEGYLNQPERTAERFVRNPFGQGLCYRTGDLARYLEDGLIEFLGRADEQVKIRGYRIEPGEVEAVLLRHAHLEQAAVIPREDALGDLRLVAYVVMRPQATATSEDLDRHLRSALPEYMIPSAVVLLPKLPLNANGKLDRKALPEPESVQAKGYEAPVTPPETALAAIWAEVLKRSPIGRNDHFFHLGGHSLLATQVVSRIRREFAIDLALRTIFESPTVAELAARIEEASARETQHAPAIVQVSRNQDLPLSFAQQRLWILDQLEPANPLYNIARALRIRGPLEVGCLEKALNEIVRRHESQRTTFAVAAGAMHAGEPVQVIAESVAMALPVMDMAALPEAERESATRNAAEQEALKPFSLATGPLLRARVFRLEKDDHVLLLTMHHIVSDAWSASVFIKELGALYSAFVHNQPSPLKELGVQYADYAVWQRQWLSGGVFQRQMAYWKKHLAGAPPILTLPADRPRPEKPSFEGSYETVRLSKELSQRLEQLSREENATLFMTLLAGFDALLGRLSGAEQVVVGTDVANRPNAEAEAMIGFFVNLLPLRTDLSGNPTFRELIGRVRDVALGAYAHQEMPFDRIVEAMQPERRSSHTPIVQVLFVMQNTPQAERRLGDLEWSPFAMPVRRSKFDLAVFVVEGPEGLVGYWLYSTELFDRETILRFAHNWETLLNQAIADPERRLSALDIWTEEDRREQDRAKKEKKQNQRSRLVRVEAKAVDWVEMSQA